MVSDFKKPRKTSRTGFDLTGGFLLGKKEILYFSVTFKGKYRNGYCHFFYLI